MANLDDENLSELTDDDKLDGIEYPPERPLGVTDRTVDRGEDSVAQRADREEPDDVAEEAHLGSLVDPGDEAGFDDEADAVATEARREPDPLGLDTSTQDLEEVRPAEEEAMHITEAPPMGDGDGYVD